MNTEGARQWLLIAVAGFMGACGTSEGCTYTLYRSSAADSAMRIHVATFDANEEENYNKENCEIAQGLFQQQPGVSVKYWCEKGRYRK